MKKILILIPLFFLFSLTFSQNEPLELITDRPDQTESSSVVPLKHLQIETGFIMARDNDKVNDTELKEFSYNTTLLRYGLLNNLELRLGIDYSGVDIDSPLPGVSDHYSGFSPLYAGIKIKIMEEKGIIPEAALLGGLIMPYTADIRFKTPYTAGDFRLALSHTISDRFSLGYNLGVEYNGITAIPSYYYSLVLGAGISDKLGFFIESYGSIPESGVAEHMADAGFTWLVLPNLQFDVSGGLGLNDVAMDYFISFGFSWRIPE